MLGGSGKSGPVPGRECKGLLKTVTTYWWCRVPAMLPVHAEGGDGDWGLLWILLMIVLGFVTLLFRRAAELMQ